MKEYTINLKLLNAVAPAVNVDPQRYYLSGIYIDDRDGFRHYTATNGHMLLTARETINGETLERPLLLGIKKAIKSKFEEVSLKVVDNTTVVIYAENKVVFDILDCEYPPYERVIPAETTPQATKYTIFEPSYLEEINKFVGDKCKVPLMEEVFSPALWIVEDGDIKKRAVLMPLRF
jgi:DNA polymerase III sliding clamp (beta) subunit (PCNA family)